MSTKKSRVLNIQDVISGIIQMYVLSFFFFCNIIKHCIITLGKPQHCNNVIKSVSMRKPGRTRQELIQLKSPILLKLGIKVEFGE